ncbi:hypothetical protein [Actinomadura opuntiae]|uniref:hypothetical protein n=1 Tax=Actinomadura sp. OS1-43 TaxID=604315 RepID=UPI00255B16D3|nr:hypothetical protein [Actinomadura sp. OS1-43]MDL4818683.1 hypothetical protein [Actinomadura sp. OS1-43]
MAILTALEALDSRGALPFELRWQVPVPVLLTADSWNPQHQSLRTWLADQLAVRYGFLTSDAYGSDAAGQLAARGKIALFLEGLDQMDAGLRQAALQQLTSEHAIRTVVMSRPRQYAAAAAAVPLSGALVIELMPVPLQDALEYLQRRQYGPAEHMTAAVVQHLQQHPDSPLAQALDSPLSLTLLRADPHANQALLTRAGVHTRREVEDLLLDCLIPRAYSAERPEGLTAEQERPWQTRIDATRTVLELIAARMTETGTTSLAWWRMHYWKPARWRIGANTAAGIIMGAIGMLVFGPIGKYTVNGHTGLRFGTKYGAFMGLCFGSLAGAISEVRDLRPARLTRLDKVLEHCPERMKRRWPQLGSAASALASFNPAIALLIFTAMIMAVGNQGGWPILGHLLFGVPAGLVAAGVTGRAAARERLRPIGRSRWIILRPTRADLLAAVSTGLPIGLTYALTKTTEFGLWAGLFTGFTFGLMTAVARPISNPDTPATPFTHDRDDRRRARRTALVVAVPIGVALGWQNGLAHGPLAGITATLGLATIISLGCMAALSDSWRTTLAFTQLHLHGRWQRFRGDQNATVFPLHGIRFLKDACAKEVMRNSGPFLTFRHTQLQHLLADAYTSRATATRQTSREDHPTPHS